MEGSSPASAAHVAAVQSHPFMIDFGSLGNLPQPTPLRELLAQIHPDPLGSSPLGSRHPRSNGVTTRSVSYRRSTRTRLDTPSPSMPSFAPPAVTSNFTTAGVAAMAAAQESRKRRAASAKTTGLPPQSKKRRAEPATTTSSNLKKAPPGSESPVEHENSPAGLKNDSDYGEEDAQPNCCICMCEPEPADLAAINGCQHKFCFDCIEKWADRENTCPLCKVRFSKIDRVNKPKRKKGEPTRKSSKQVKMRDQRSIPESALEGLVASFSAAGAGFPQHSIARLLFSGMGSGFFEFGPTRIVRAREVRFDNGPRPIVFGPRSDLFDDPMLSSDDEDETFSGFISQMRRVQSQSRSIRLQTPNVQRFGGSMAAAVASAASASPSPPARSYAVNMGETNAGHAHNPLEIEDDSDDDEVEVVEVVTNLE